MSERKNTEEIASTQYDVAILGGGLAGLTLALQLKKSRPNIKILVIEKQKHPVSEAAHKVGESTVEIATKYLQNLGLGEHLNTRQLRKFGLRFFFSTEDNQDVTRRVEMGLAALHIVPSYQLDRGRLENMLGEEVQQRGVLFLDACKVEQIALQPDVHTIHVSREGEGFDVQAHWVVDASGRSSLLKRQLGLAKKVAHKANAVWFRVDQKIDIDEWSSSPEWHARITSGERYLSTNHLCGQGYWVWLIPLASGSTSVGIVSDPAFHSFDTMNRFERALEWLRLHEPQCARALENSQAEVQDFRVMKDYAYSCQQVYSSERWCLTGEAGVFVDPFYSPGSDFIAMSNGFVTDLITSELNDEDIQERARAYNHAYLGMANGWFHTYEQQYHLLGNAQVMVAKYIWDTALYWGSFTLLYFHDKLRDMVDNRTIAINLYRVSLLGTRIQAFFREWAAIDQEKVTNAFVDHCTQLGFMQKFHAGIVATLTDAEFEAEFVENISLLEQVAGQMVWKVSEAYLAYADNEAVLKQIQSWRTDPILAKCIALYQQNNQPELANSSWIYLAQERNPAEAAAKL
jgi:flavin-dependent dehydrogenase